MSQISGLKSERSSCQAKRGRPQSERRRIVNDAQKMACWRQWWSVSVCGYFPSLSTSSSVESVDHATYSALASQTPRLLLFNVLPLSYLPCPWILDRQAVYDCVWSRELRFFSGRWGFQNVAQLNQKQFKEKLRVNIRGKVFPHCNYEWRSHIWPERLVFSTLYQP